MEIVLNIIYIIISIYFFISFLHFLPNFIHYLKYNEYPNESPNNTCLVLIDSFLWPGDIINYFLASNKTNNQNNENLTTENEIVFSTMKVDIPID